MSEKKTPTWTNIRRRLDDWPKSGLIALIRDLCEASPENRDFLQARLAADEGGAGAALENYRRKIEEEFFPARGLGRLKLAEARKAIRTYRKATGNLAGTIDLMLTFIENGAEFTREFGDVNEPFYNNLESVLNEMARLLLDEGPQYYPQFQERVQGLSAHVGHIGWGFGDALRDQIDLLESELGGD